MGYEVPWELKWTVEEEFTDYGIVFHFAPLKHA